MLPSRISHIQGVWGMHPERTSLIRPNSPEDIPKGLSIVPRSPPASSVVSLPDYPNLGGLGDESPNGAPYPEN